VDFVFSGLGTVAVRIVQPVWNGIVRMMVIDCDNSVDGHMINGAFPVVFGGGSEKAFWKPGDVDLP